MAMLILSFLAFLLLLVFTLVFDAVLEYEPAKDSRPNTFFHKILRKLNGVFAGEDPGHEAEPS